MIGTPRIDELERCNDFTKSRDLQELLDAAREFERENATLLQRLNWGRRNCRIIYEPPGLGPITHAPDADMWDVLLVAADTA